MACTVEGEGGYGRGQGLLNPQNLDLLTPEK